MKTSKSSKLRYYYSPELGVMMPVPVIHRLRYWALAVIVLVAAAGYLFTAMSRTRSEARNLSEVTDHQESVAAEPKSGDAPDESAKPET